MTFLRRFFAATALLACAVEPALAVPQGTPNAGGIGALSIGNALSELQAAGSQAVARANLGLLGMALQAPAAVAITGGAIDGTAVGGTTPAAGAFTTLAASGLATLKGSAQVLGSLYVTPSSGSATAVLNKPASGGAAQIYGQTGGVNRWLFGLGSSGAETGSNAGSDFALYRFSDNGTYLDGPMSISRATGMMFLNDGLTVSGNTLLAMLSVSGHVLTGSAAPALSGCGTSPTIMGSDRAGLITTGTGATACTATFAAAYAAVPFCTVTGQTAAVTYAVTKTAITITAGASVPVNYNCVGQVGG